MAKIDHPKLIDLLQQAYSAERAAAFAYIGHANSVRNPEAKKAIRQIEIDEWNHRDEVLKIMKEYDVPVSNYYEVKFYLMGRLISFSCHVIGWFMPYYFAGRLESGNVCEYFFMMQYFHSLEIRKHDDILFEMGIKEKEHEVYFLNQIKHSKLLPFFEKVFAWGKTKSFNDVNMNEVFFKSESHAYCKHHNEQENSHKSV
ncbi:MAG: ferritin-like domain-containing protein [Flavobacteriales bacterium]|nr:ferritin-like domain-containing protein [Flavobacteriales bacterium]